MRNIKKYRQRTNWLLLIQRTIATMIILVASTHPTVVRAQKELFEPTQTTSPRATLFSFINTMNRAYRVGGGDHPGNSAKLIAKAIRYLDLSELSESSADYLSIESALKLKEVLDRIEIPDRSDVPGRLEATGQSRETGIIKGGEASTIVPPITLWQIPGTNIEIHRIETGLREGEYLFTPRTVSRVPVWYDRIKDKPYKEGATPGIYEAYSLTPGREINLHFYQRLPNWSQWTFADQTVWQWVAAVLTLLILFVFIGYALKFARVFDGNLNSGQSEENRRSWKPASLIALLAITLTVWGVDYAIDDIYNLTGAVLLWLGFMLKLLRYVFTAWFTFVLISQIFEMSIWIRGYVSNSALAQLFRLVGYFIGGTAVILILFQAAHSFGLPAYSIVTGFGVTGIAVSLAARETLQDIFSTFEIMIERPYRIGDYIEVGKFAGTVLQIGFRSTKIRTQSDVIVTIPHSSISSGPIATYSSIPAG
ncbi:MAG: mechanosensitive ion channel [Arenicellales bacterium]|nr:mechanosensitive ion channel [Arenicellales bacterium]